MRTQRPGISQDEVFAILERHAVAGDRCPQRDQLPPRNAPAMSALARAGRIRIEVYAHNWRVVEILSGPNKGKRTAPCPNKTRGPYLVIEKESRYRTRRWSSPPVSSGAQPSAPRPLAPHELK